MPELNEFHTQTTYPMSVAEDFIKESPEYWDYLLKDKLSHHDSILKCLQTLGMDTENVSLNYGIIRLAKNRLYGYYGNVYIGFTRPEFKYKHLYENIQTLSPVMLPKGSTKVVINELGEEFSTLELSEEEKEIIEEVNKKEASKRMVRIRKYDNDEL